MSEPMYFELPAPIDPGEFWALVRDLFDALGDRVEVPESVPAKAIDLPPREGRRRTRTEWLWCKGEREVSLSQEDEWSGEGLVETGGLTVAARVEGLPGGARVRFPSRPSRLASYLVLGVPEAAGPAEAALLRLSAARLASRPVTADPSTMPEWTRLAEAAPLAAPVIATCLGHLCATEVDGVGFGVILEPDRRVPLGPIPRGGHLRGFSFTGADGAPFPKPLTLLALALGGEALPGPAYTLEGGTGDRAARVAWRCVTAGPWIARSTRRASSGGAGFDERVVLQTETGEPLAVFARYRMDRSPATLREGDCDVASLTLEVEALGPKGDTALTLTRIRAWLEEKRWTRRL